MMRRACLLLFVLLAPALTPFVGAAPLVDPLIGVRGTLSSSPAITDSSLQPFVDCGTISGISGPALPSSYLCAPYDTLGMDIFSLTLQFFNRDVDPFPVGALSLDFANSFFDTMQFVDNFTVRLSNDVVPTLSAAAIADPWPFTGLVIFTAAGPNEGDVPASWVSVLAVNDVTNVPEPAAMLLLGAGVVAAGVRRRRAGLPS